MNQLSFQDSITARQPGHPRRSRALLPAMFLLLLSSGQGQGFPPGPGLMFSPQGNSASSVGCQLQNSPGLDAGAYSAIDVAPRQVQFWFSVACSGQQTWAVSLDTPGAAGQAGAPLTAALSDSRGHDLTFQASLTPSTGGGGAAGPAQLSLNINFAPGQFAAPSGAYSGDITVTLSY